jgi:hypothetical protein
VFETVALLAQAVAFACHGVLLAAGHGSWLDLSIDAVELVTFGIGKGLIGGAEATAEISEAAASSYRAVAGDGSSVAALIEAGDTAAETAKDVDGVDLMPFASGTAWALSSRIESYGQLFRVAQGTGVGTDLTSKLDQVLNLGGLPLPGYDNLKAALGPGGG